MKKMGKIIALMFCVLIIATGCSSDNSKKISLGSWNENVYTNDFLGLEYTKPDDWTRYTDEQIKDVMDLGSELTDASELSKKLAELTSVTYMMTSGVDGSNVLVMSERNITGVKEEDYAKSLKSQLEAQNLGYVLEDVKTETINNKEFTTLEAMVSTIKQKYYIYKVDKYFISIIVTSTTTDISDIIEQFKFN